MSGPRYRQARHDEPTLFELDVRTLAGDLPAEPLSAAGGNPLPDTVARKMAPRLPNLPESEVVRHYTVLSQMNFGVDSGFYPLGSCTMKFNPKVSEELAASNAAGMTHPLQHESMVQGTLAVMWELQEMLCRIGGMDAVSLQPAAGAQGEFTGMLMVRAFHDKNGDDGRRTEVILPDTAHGTNPASAAMAGFDVISIPSKDGKVDLEALDAALSERTAAFMLTNPNTLGIFEHEAEEIARRVHDSGALLYYDGANFNAIMGKTNPGKLGFDIVHFNLHKTFATPHGGGGPGAGAVGVVEKLAHFLPRPIVMKDDSGNYYLENDMPDSIGKVHGFHGNWGVILRAYIYTLLHGGPGLERATERAVLNSNYLRAMVEKHMDVPYPGLRKHEFVASACCLEECGLRALDVAKRVLDFGFHPPTVYFPQLVHEALMIEPTESASKANLDAFAGALAEICEGNPELAQTAPHNTAVGRVDEVEAAKKLIFSFFQNDG